MRKSLAALSRAGVAVLLTWILAGAASADGIQTFQPTPPDLYDLDHSEYYKWGISMPDYLEEGPVTSAALIFSNIYNWQSEPNKLYIHLLDTAPLGVTVYSDQDGSGDALSGEGILLKTYSHLPATPQTLIYDFTSSQLATLNQYLANGEDMGLGFDPDCHFYNCGIAFQIGRPTTEIPEPGTVALVGTAALGLFGCLRRRRMR